MPRRPDAPRRILLAFSDTGGGHRAAARHLTAALERTGAPVEIRHVDPYAESGRWPFARLHAAYPAVVNRASWLWRLGFGLTNSRLITRLAQRLAWPVLRRTFMTLRGAQTPDVIVSTHPLLASPLRRVFPTLPIVVVVTDLVSGHVSWYDRSADLIVVPTAAAHRQALACGVPHERVTSLGLPVDAGGSLVDNDPSMLAGSLGWHRERPTVLLVGGGDGVGPIEAIAAAIDAAQLPCDLAIVTGRNAALRERLSRRRWLGTVHVYGFVHDMNVRMRAAHAVITKAGPGTICESFAVGRPVILFSAIPGQETGNVAYAVDAGAGVWAPSPVAVTRALQAWLEGPDASHAWGLACTAARATARPRAADDIAALVLALSERPAQEDSRGLPSATERPALTFPDLRTWRNW